MFYRCFLGFISLVSVLLLAGCGGAGGGEAWLPDDVRLASLQAVQDAFDARTGEDPEVDNAQLLAVIQTMPEFEASGLSEDGAVWARYTDGQLLIVANNRKPPEDPSPAVSLVVDGGRAPTEIPRDEEVTFLNAMGSLFHDPTPNAQPMLDNGYAISSSDVSVDGLKSVNGANGVFYIDSHGGSGQYRLGNVAYAVATGTLATATTLGIYRSDLRAGRLAYFLAEYDEPATPGGPPISEMRLAITPAFVRRYMSFSGNCLVFVDACNSDNTSFKQAFLDRGASVYAGWSNTVIDQIAFDAGNYLFKRLASSGTEPSATYPTIKNDMAQLSPRLDLDPASGAELIFTANTTAGAGDFGLLAPKITTVTPDRTANTLLLVGVFGANPGTGGKVEVGGAPISVTSWQPYSVLCSLPASASGSVVVTVRGHKSNSAGPVPPTGGGGGTLKFWEDQQALTAFISGEPMDVVLTESDGNVINQTAYLTFQHDSGYGIYATSGWSIQVFLNLSSPTDGFVESPADDHEPWPGRVILLTSVSDDGSFYNAEPDIWGRPGGVDDHTVLQGDGRFTLHFLTRSDGSKYTAVSLDLIFSPSGELTRTHEIHEVQRYVREGWNPPSS